VGLVIAGGLATTALGQEVPVFPTTTEAVYVDALVQRHGHNVPGLGASDFEIRDNGVLQHVDLIPRGKVPLHAVLVFDVSGSVAGGRLSHLRGSARVFLEGLGVADRVAVVAFNHVLWLAAGPAASPSEARSALDRLRASGGTALYDAVYAGVTIADTEVGRPVVLVFSDGENRLSWLTRERAVEASRRSDAVVYGIGAGNLETAAKRFLRDLAGTTGGRVWETRDEAELRAASAQLLVEIQERYLLRYEPAGVATPGWHALAVRVRGQRGDVRTRSGYFRR
jgi:VWFA-related protein